MSASPEPSAPPEVLLPVTAITDWVVPIVVALITGVLAALLTGWLARAREDRAARRAGIVALRAMHRCLYDLAQSLEDEEIGANSNFSGVDYDDLRTARERAYEHLGVLKRKHRDLVRRADMDGFDRMDESGKFWTWARDLEAAIDKVDPNVRPRIFDW